jgi:hypothetical protein
MDKEKLLKLFESFIDSVVPKDDGVKSDVAEIDNVVKSVDELQRRALFVVMPPDTVDLHGDIYSVEEVEKACISFNTSCMKAGAYHAVELSSELAVIEQSFTSLTDFTTESGEFIKKGTWLQWWHFPKPDDEINDVVWPKVISGHFTGVSIQCQVQYEMVE